MTNLRRTALASIALVPLLLSCESEAPRFLVTGAAARRHVSIVTQPNQALSGLNLGTQPVVQVRDQGDNVVPDSVPITAAIAVGSGTLQGGTTAMAVDGEARFSSLRINGIGAHTIVFSGVGVDPDTSDAVVVGQQAAALSVRRQPAGATTTTSFSVQPELQVVDNAGLPVVSAVDVTAALATGSGTLSGTTTVQAIGGVVAFTDLTITGSGSHSLRFSAAGVSSVTSATFSVTPMPGIASLLAVSTQPSGSVSGAVLTTQPVVQVRDGLNGVVPGSNASVTVVIASGSGVLSGATTVNAINGVATFTDLAVTGGGTHTLRFNSGSLTPATSNAFGVASGPATPLQLAISTQPNGAVSDDPFTTQPVVQIRDGANILVPSSTDAVSVAIASGSGSLSGTTTVAAVGGVATFTDLTISGVGTHTLRFTSGTLVAATSGSFVVGAAAGTATQLGIATQPAGVVSGVSFTTQPVVQIRDANNSVVQASTAPVTVAIASGSGILSGTTTINAVNGVATFSDLSISGGSAHTLRFTSPGLSSVTTISFTVAPAPGTATKLGIATQPAGAVTGQAFTTPPVVHVRDVNNNLVSSTVTISAVIASGTGALSGTTSVAAVGGVATFSNLVITGSGAHTVRFTATGLTAITSSSFTVAAGPPTQLAITTQPSSGTVTATPFPQQPVIRLRDAGGNNVGQGGVVVTAALATGPGTLIGTLTATTNSNGVASFTDLGITGLGAHTLVFTAPALTSVTSAVTTATDQVLPLLVEDFSSYTSTANLLADPRGIWNAVEAQNSSRVALDMTVGYGGSPNSMRYDWPNNGATCRDYEIKPGTLEFPAQGHIWIEYVVRFSTNFSVSAGASGCATEYKLAALFGASGGAGRWNVPEMQGGSWVLGYPNTVFSIGGNPGPSSYWNGQPVVFRVEARASTSGQGILRFWVNGVLKENRTGFSTTQSNIYAFAPGLNINQGPAISGMHIWWHKITVYNTNPGW